MKTGLFLFVLAFTSSVQGQESKCSTPDGGVGICKPIAQCENLLKKVQEFNTVNSDEQQKIMTELRARKCGYDQDSRPMVCCSDCVTPDGKSGLVKYIRSCPHLLKLLTNATIEARRYILRSRTTPTSFDVCCGPPRASTNERCNGLFGSPPEPASKCCGIDTFFEDRIVGGKTAGISEFPWMVLLEYRRKGKTQLNCGGSLITNKHVITAAHCVSGDQLPQPLAARIGEYNTINNGSDCVENADGTNECNDGAFSVRIHSIKIHPEYNTNGENNDIAIVTLENPVRYTNYVRPICLPTQASITDYFKVAGWGRVSQAQSHSNLKQVVTLNSYNSENCRRKYYEKYRRSITEKQVCAGGDPGKDSCTGDSGGPLMSEVSSPVTHYELAGVVSFGPTPCGSSGWPGVYTDVYKYLDWIRDNII